MPINMKFLGKTYPPVKYEVGLEKIKEYAQAIGDMNPYYVDENFAKSSKYGSIVAPPTFAVVYQKDLVGQMLFDRELDLNIPMLVHGEQEFEFFEMVKPGDVIYTDGKIVDIQNKDGKDFITLQTTAKRDGKVVTIGRYLFVIRG